MAHIEKTTVVRDDHNEDEVAVHSSPTWTLAKVVYLLSSLLTALLAMRFLLSLLGANRGNPFANFIYDLSQPFASPFFGLFNYEPQYGVARFEIETLVAIGVYAFVAWMIIRLVTVSNNDVA